MNVIWSQRHNCRMALFETMILDWLQRTSIQAASQEIGFSWKVASRNESRVGDEFWLGKINRRLGSVRR